MQLYKLSSIFVEEYILVLSAIKTVNFSQLACIKRTLEAKLEAKTLRMGFGEFIEHHGASKWRQLLVDYQCY
jgi:hypothetical protein